MGIRKRMTRRLSSVKATRGQTAKAVSPTAPSGTVSWRHERGQWTRYGGCSGGAFIDKKEMVSLIAKLKKHL